MLVLLEAEQIAAQAHASPRAFLAGTDLDRIGCLILDIHMPEMSGLELLAILRQRGVTSTAIMLTGRGEPALDETARRLGATVLPKPPDDVLLLDLVRTA